MFATEKPDVAKTRLADSAARRQGARVRAPRIIPALACLSLAFAPVRAATVVLTDPAYGAINASALDQPRLYALISDPAQGNAFITWLNPNTGAVEPVLITAFVDTGASGFAISYLHASGELDQPDLGLAAADHIGAFTETGIGGQEVGDVTRPLGVWVSNLPVGGVEEVNGADFTAYGDFSLWVRREAGAAEVQEIAGFPLISPLNLVGMPVIRQRRMRMDSRPMAELGALVTELLAPGAAEPETQFTVPLVLRDFIGDTPPPGEVAPSHYANPLVPGMTLRHGAGSATGEWLLDTGAGSTFASFAQAKACGLIPASYATLADFMADYTGPTAQIGGIGASQLVPRLTVERIEVATREGATLVWQNVEIMVADVAGLDGIFGMNLLVPAVTVDPADPLGSLFDISPGAFADIVIDTTNAADPTLRLATPRAAGTYFEWLGARFAATERGDALVGAAASDPDGDGLSNLLEYALGLDPRVKQGPDAAPDAGVVEIGGQRRLSLAYERPAGGGRTDVEYRVEISRDLVAWSSGDAETTTETTTLPDGRERVTTTSTAAIEPRLFMRLNVELRP